MTKIEWTNKTLNVITGCTKHSEGCQNCYAEKMHKRLNAMGAYKYREPFDTIKYYPLEFVTAAFLKAKKCGAGVAMSNSSRKGYLIFLNSMSDTFNPIIPDDDIKEILDNCKIYQQHIFQVLTKRAERLPDFNYPENVWLGVTVEMAKYKSRTEYLKKTNAKVKFLSCEPLLDDLGKLDLAGIDWVIAGGESGSNARPCHPNWVRNIQKQCEEQGVPFFFKQWGEWFPRSQWEYSPDLILNDETNFVFEEEIFNKVGKKKAGSLLDGRSYKEYPGNEQKPKKGVTNDKRISIHIIRKK